MTKQHTLKHPKGSGPKYGKKNHTLAQQKKVSRSKKPRTKKLKGEKRGRKPFFSDLELNVLKKIIDRRLRLSKKISRQKLASKFWTQTG